MAKLNIVLYEPEIPSNTGNIGRTCVATGTRLHLIEPMGFRLNEKSIKRAGMDYWDDLDVTRYIDYQDFLEKNPGAKIYMASTKAPQTYTIYHIVDHSAQNNRCQGKCERKLSLAGKLTEENLTDDNSCQTDNDSTASHIDIRCPLLSAGRFLRCQYL